MVLTQTKVVHRHLQDDPDKNIVGSRTNCSMPGTTNPRELLTKLVGRKDQLPALEGKLSLPTTHNSYSSLKFKNAWKEFPLLSIEEEDRLSARFVEILELETFLSGGSRLIEWRAKKSKRKEDNPGR